MQKEEDRRQGQSNIVVAIRVRPLNSKEEASGNWDIVRIQDKLIIILDPIQMEFEAENKKMLEVLHRSKQQRYAFDRVYRNQDSQRIYEETVQPLIRTVITGKNATVFAYGPTGTGKTHTMLGTPDVYGLNVLAIRDIFNLIEEDELNDYSITITYVQIYNEMIRDLLVQNSGYLELRDDSDKGIFISGVTEFKAQSTQQVMNLLLFGNKRRTTESTNANQTSSRSHAVFQVNIAKTSKTRNTSIETLIGKLSLIDLAGSERGTVTENRGIRLVEGAKINRSLLALANCINALGDKNKKGFFVPYRDSKLTRLLKDSLGGNCKTVMIVNISPASSQFEETINTLKYANRAKNIKTKQITNKKLVSIHISQYKSIINDLRLQIEQLKFKLQKTPQIDIIDYGLNVEQNSQLPKKDGTIVCQCGKIEESGQIRRIKEQVFENFNERIQLRRALMEIQEQNAINILEIKRKQGQIVSLRKSEVNSESQQGKRTLEEIRKLGRVVQTLKLNTHKNILKKQITNLQLMESMSATKKIREQISKKIKSRQNRELLEIIIKNHVLELQNIELQINLQIQQKIIGDLKNIASSQKNLIELNGIDIKIEQQDDNNDDIQLQVDDDSEGNDEDQQPQITDDYYDIQNQLLLQKRKAKKDKSLHKLEPKDNQENQDRKKRSNQHSENFIPSAKKKPQREKTVNSTSNHHLPPANQQSLISNNNILDLNLKGVNVRLNEKLPMTVISKDKKKKL